MRVAWPDGDLFCEPLSLWPHAVEISLLSLQPGEISEGCGASGESRHGSPPGHSGSFMNCRQVLGTQWPLRPCLSACPSVIHTYCLPRCWQAQLCPQGCRQDAPCKPHLWQVVQHQRKRTGEALRQLRPGPALSPALRLESRSDARLSA